MAKKKNVNKKKKTIRQLAEKTKKSKVVKKKTRKNVKKNKNRSKKKFNNKSKKSNVGITKIKVIGVGGGGGNIISRMKSKGNIKGVEYIAINTDAQDLEESLAHKKIHIGKALTKGMGAGMDVNIGRQAVDENKAEINDLLEGADIVFITAGFGGGTGTGAAPVIADIAKSKGILTIGIVTRPFKFEGASRTAIAQEGIDQIRDNTDALVVIPNDRVFSIINKDTPILKAFEYIDNVLKDGVEAIADLINIPGIINVDFSDVKTILKDRGSSIIGVGIAKGQDRSIKAVEEAINSPLLESSIEGAKGVLFSIAGGSDLKMSEVNDIAELIVKNLDPNVQVIFGTSKGRGLNKNTIKITVIATGFNGISTRTDNSFNVPQLFSDERKIRINRENRKRKRTSPASEEEKIKNNSQAGGKDLSDGGGGEDDSYSSHWDIPTFLRKKDK